MTFVTPDSDTGNSYSPIFGFMNSGIFITHLVYIKPGQEAALAEYESLVLPLINRYNGHIVARVRPATNDILVSDAANLHELHVVHFGSQKDFENYLNDPDRKQHITLKEQAIERSITIKGNLL